MPAQGGQLGSAVLNQPPDDQPVKRAGSRAVPGPSKAARPRALQSADHRLYPFHMVPTEPPLIDPSAAGLAGIRRPDALLRHSYRAFLRP